MISLIAVIVLVLYVGVAHVHIYSVYKITSYHRLRLLPKQGKL